MRLSTSKVGSNVQRVAAVKANPVQVLALSTERDAAMNYQPGQLIHS
jgi:hypothetical protein